MKAWLLSRLNEGSTWAALAAGFGSITAATSGTTQIIFAAITAFCVALGAAKKDKGVTDNGANIAGN